MQLSSQHLTCRRTFRKTIFCRLQKKNLFSRFFPAPFGNDQRQWILFGLKIEIAVFDCWNQCIAEAGHCEHSYGRHHTQVFDHLTSTEPMTNSFCRNGSESNRFNSSQLWAGRKKARGDSNESILNSGKDFIIFPFFPGNYWHNFFPRWLHTVLSYTKLSTLGFQPPNYVQAKFVLIHRIFRLSLHSVSFFMVLFNHFEKPWSSLQPNRPKLLPDTANSLEARKNDKFLLTSWIRIEWSCNGQIVNDIGTGGDSHVSSRRVSRWSRAEETWITTFFRHDSIHKNRSELITGWRCRNKMEIGMINYEKTDGDFSAIAMLLTSLKKNSFFQK